MSMRTVNYRAPRFAAAAAEPFALAAASLLGVALVVVALQIDGGAHPATDVALGAGALACLIVILAGPIPCLMAIAGLTAAGLSPKLIALGGVDLTLVDIFFGGLVIWCLWESIGRAQRVFPDRPHVAFGQFAAIVFLGYSGLSLWHILSAGDAPFSGSLVSWLRLVQTVSLAWLASTVLKSKRDLQLLMAAIAIGAVVAVVIAASAGGVLLVDRSGGTLGPDTLGLVASVLILIAAFGVPTRMRAVRITLILVGVAGLLLGKSVGSSVAVAVALAVGTAVNSGTGATQRLFRGALVAVVAGAVAFGIVHATRPEQIPGSPQFSYSSTYSRIVVGAAGLEIFEHHPIFGVGWRGSNSPSVIGDPEINIAVRRQLPNANPIFYADVTPTSVHNTYIQILADLGLVGFGLFIWLIGTVGFRTRALLQRLGREHELWPIALVSALGLLLAVIWYNDNPLYGGQPETVLPALFVGILVAIAQFTAPRPSQMSSSMAGASPFPGGFRGSGSGYATSGAHALEAPLLRPGAGRRLGSIAAIVVVSGVIGLVAGWGTANDEPALSPGGSSPAATHYDKVVTHELASLSSIRSDDLQELIAAETPAEQQNAGILIARAYETTAQALAQTHPSAAEQDAQTSLVAELRRVAVAYRQLAAAAADADTDAYDAARHAIEHAEADLPPPIGSDLTDGSH